MARSYKTTFIIDGDSSGAVQAQRNVRNESQALTRELENAERQNEELSASFESVSRRATQLTTFLGATAAAAGTLATRQTLAITEQQNLARTLDVSVQTLQEWQFAANQVGVDSGKLGDVFKDVSDKLGDFVATGGGEAADLFEKLNINVDKLQNMGPAEQLLAIGQALDDVGSQSQKVFFLESIADDASRLLPLLENNGELLKENAELARQLGISIPQKDVDSIKDAGDALKELQGVGTGFANEIAIQAAPAIRDLTDDVRGAIDTLGGMENAVDTMEAGVATLATALSARLAGSLATATTATTRKIKADIAAASQARLTEAAEAGHAAALARTAAAEKTAAANNAALAAQRAASARQEAAAEVQRIQSLQASLAAERALEAQRIQAQITAKGRQQSINRMAELRRTEVATTNQATAANTRLAEAETAEAAAARQARLAKVEQTQASTAATAASGRYTAATRAATTANRALAVSGRALSGAMGLLGGPAGVAIVAAGAIYTFREELGLVPTEARSAADELGDLKGRIEGVTRASIDSEIAGFTAELVRLQSQAGQARDAIDTLEEAKSQPTSYGQGQQADLSFGITRQQSELNELDSKIEARQRAVEQLRDMQRDVDNEGSGNPGEISNTKKLIDAYDQQHQKLQQLRADRAELQQLIKGDPEHADQYRRMLEENADQIDKATKSTKDNSEAKQAAKEAEREHQKALNDSASAYADLFAELSPVGKAQADYQSTLGDLQVALDEGTKSELEYYAAVGQAAQVYNDAVDAADPYSVKLDDIIEKYDSASQKGQQLQVALETVNEAWRRDPEHGDQYARVVGNIRDEMRDLALESDPMAKEMARAWDEAADRIDETFADAFTGAFDSFDDFGDQLLDGFKQLLAELAYQATLKPIVVDFTAQARSTMGIPGAGGNTQSGGMGGAGGMGSLSSIGKNVYNGITDGFGSINWAGAPTSYSGGFAGSATAGTGTTSAGGSYFGGSTSNFGGASGLASIGTSYAGSYVGSEIGGAVSDKQANSNYGQMAGTAIGTYFGGPIGAGIGSAIGSVVDTVFGSGGSDLDLAMVRGSNDNSHDWDHGVRASGALGTVGFQNEGSHELLDLWNKEDAQQVVDAIAATDTQLASLADNDSELSAMQDAVLASNRHGIQGHYGETSNPGDVVGRLTSRYKDAIDVLDSAFEDTLLVFDGSADKLVNLTTALDTVENAVGDNVAAMADARSQLNASDDIVATAQTLAQQAQAMGVLSDAAEQLNLTFDSTAQGALAASGNMAELVGGLDNLNTLQQQYYSTFTTDEERQARLKDNLEGRFDELGLDLPDTADGFRDLVEAQNLMTDAGREQYAALLNLVPTMSDYIDVTEQASDALEQQVAQLSGWIDDLLLSDQSTLDPGERYQEAQSQYASVLVRAEDGDADAIGNLGSVADQYLKEAASYYGQGSSQYGSLFDEILEAAQGIDGSHAKGLASVPFDGYRAELHSAETVLPAPIAQLYRESAPGSSTNREMLAELQGLRRESQQLREEVRQLRGERAQDASSAAGQRADQLREQQRINRNTKTRPTTV